MSIESSGPSGSGETARHPDLARLLRARRAALGLSRKDVAAATGLSYPFIAQLESGIRAPSVASARRLAGVLGLPVEEIVLAAGAGVAPSPGWFGNPAYARDAQGIASSPPRGAAAAVLMQEAPPATPIATPIAAPPATPIAAPAAGPPTGDVVDAVVALLGTLPPEGRLNALALVQGRLMEELVREHVRKATQQPES